MMRAMSASSNATVVAVGSQSREHSSILIAECNLDPRTTLVFGSYEDVINHSSVEAVYVSLPTAMQCAWAVNAARKRKHVLLEVPTALSVEELDRILKVCIENRVQFMDSTIWLHHPRTEQMKQFISNGDLFGNINMVNSIFAYDVNNCILQNKGRFCDVNYDLRALGDAGWYCISSILWAYSYNLPHAVMALPDPVKNDSGVLLACGAELFWPDCMHGSLNWSYLDHLTMQITVIGTKGTLRVTDFVIPYEEEKASFEYTVNANFNKLKRCWNKGPIKHEVPTEFAQETRMVQKFADLVQSIKEGAEPELQWGEMSRRTQLVLDAVKVSIAEGFRLVQVTE